MALQYAACEILSTEIGQQDDDSADFWVTVFRRLLRGRVPTATDRKRCDVAYLRARV